MIANAGANTLHPLYKGAAGRYPFDMTATSEHNQDIILTSGKWLGLMHAVILM